MSAAIKLPTAEDAQAAKVALRQLRGISGEIQDHSLQLVAEGGDPTVVEVPPGALALLQEILEQMAAGNAVTVLPVQGELTTQETADLLNVSRPHLVKLLEEGQIPYRKVGSHRRVKVADALVYKEKERARQLAVLAELTAEAQALDMGY